MSARPIVPESYPLAPIQAGMLFNSLAAPASGVDVMQRVIELDEDLDGPRFEAAWQRVVAEHPALRTAFRWEGLDAPRQDVYRDVTPPIRFQDWSATAADEAEQLWQNLVQRDRREGFVLSAPPLTRLTIVRLGPGAQRVLWTAHHALFDGPALILLLGQVLGVYAALAGGEPYRIEPAPAFAEHIEWLQSRSASSAEAFWRTALDGLPGPTRLGIELSGADAARRDGHAQRELRLSATATSALADWVRAHELTLNIAVQGAWSLLLNRYSGDRRVVFGAVKSCRKSTVAGAERTVGVLLNTLPRVVDVDPEAELLAWLTRLREQWIELREFEHTPLIEIQGWSDVGGRRPLFENVLCFDPLDFDGGLRAAGVAMEGRRVRVFDQTNYPLALNAYGERELLLRATYDRSRLADAAVERMLGHLAVLLEALPRSAESRLKDLSLLTAAERGALLETFVAPPAPYPSERCIHELFEEQAARAPDVLAVDFEDGALTYRELNERANDLAHRLRAGGVTRGSRVATCLGRSFELAVAFLGILKAGGAYVPLDPENPEQRLALLLADAGAAVVVTAKEWRARLPAFAGQVICLDDGGPAARGAGRGGATSGTAPDEPAYVIYTSGSTGAPKGVCVPHRAVVRLVRGTDFVELTPDDRIAQASVPSFDATTFEIWGALLNGARLVGVPRPVVLDPDRLEPFLRERGISVMFATTALLNQLVGQRADVFAPLRCLLFGGEAADPRSVRAVLEHGRPQHLQHVYGPTENTTFSTWYAVEELHPQATTVPIGRPIANTEAYVLDPSGAPAPLGVPGELYLGGDGLALEYLGAPELTAERFVPHPFRADPKARLFRTRDLVRVVAGGELEFLGRLDAQLKIRGHRIEPGEIEAALLRSPGVREAVVVAREDVPGDVRLVAYVVPDEGREGVPAELDRLLRKELPSSMVPAAIVPLDALPLSPNGKLDRRALPAPRARPAGRAFVAPRGATEARIAEVWSELLRIEQVGATDGFFDLGGHSLLAMRAVNRLRDALGLELPLSDFLEDPTVAGLAERVELRRWAAEGEKGPVRAEDVEELEL